MRKSNLFYLYLYYETMKTSHFIPLAALFIAGSAAAQPSVRIAGGPWLQQPTDEGVTVVWTTTLDAAAWVEVAPDDGSHFYAAERPRYYDTHIGRRRTGRLHRVRVDGLEPGRTYRYRLMQQAVLADEGNRRVVLGEGYGSDILKHAPYPAATHDAQRNSVSFWMVCDIHGRDSIYRLLLDGAGRARPDFVCLNGDMLTQIEDEAQLLDGYLRTTGEVLGTAGIPIVVTRGNHENRGSHASRFLDYFPTPTGETYYGFRQGPAYFLVLDGGEDKPDSDIRYYGLAASDAYRAQEAAWLERAVRSEEFRSAEYRIVLIHMPPDAEGWYGCRETARLFVPILNRAGIDLMLCGHYHRLDYIDDGSHGTDFPILVNSDRDRVAVTAGPQGIGIEVTDTSGKTIRRHRIGKRNR